MATGQSITGQDHLDDYLAGGLGDDTLIGLGGYDYLDGGAGVDTMIGGADSDTYWVDNEQDTVVEDADEGFDSVYSSSINYTLGDHVETIQLDFGSAALNALGNALSNELYGNENNNRLDGGAGDDMLYGGGAGVDTLVGGMGNDLFYIDSDKSTVIEAEDEGTDTIVAIDISSYTLAPNIENGVLESYQATVARSLSGNALNNELTGSWYADKLFGGAGHDTLDGGNGNDTLIGQSGDDIISAGNGNDQLFGDTALVINARGNTWAASSEKPNIQVRINGSVVGSADLALMDSGGQDYYVAADFLTGPNTQIDVQFTNAVRYYNGSTITSYNHLTINSIIGNSVNLLPDFYVRNTDGSIKLDANGQPIFYPYDLSPGMNGAQVINFNKNGVMVYGGFVRFTLDTQVANTGNDTLDGGLGADTMSGGNGDDTYHVDNAGDIVYEASGFGNDTVYASTSWTMGEHIEKLVLTGMSALNATGNAQANLIEGNHAANRLDGAGGADTLTGGLGNDAYVIDNAQDNVVELAGEGVDTVWASVSHTLAANVESLILTGLLDINGTGQSSDNVITGNVAANVLDGAGGADTLIGGDGADTYVIDSLTDVVVEASDLEANGDTHNSGVDSVVASMSYTLGANVENLTLTGSALTATGNELDNTLTGTQFDNVLTGLGGDDHLDGGAGMDTLTGGTGSDTYVVDNTGDVIHEDADAGTDTVISSIGHTLAANLENLQLSGNAIVVGTGNARDNVLISNEGNTENGDGTKLYGLAGNDTLISAVSYATDHQSLHGGTGDDFYQISVSSGRPPKAVELAGEGNDTVYYWGGSYTDGGTLTLADNIENGIRSMVGTSTSAIATLNGNQLNNMLTGSMNRDKLNGLGGNDTLQGGFGKDTLDGGTGLDLMNGGGGDDLYIVDDGGDLVVERSGEGTDSVQASISYTLTDNVERLTLSGANAINASGNRLNNLLTGNAGNNVFNGRQGNDTLSGGNGNDTYSFSRGDGADMLLEENTLVNNSDVLAFQSGVNAEQLWFRQRGNNLEISVIGTRDSVTISNWYLDDAHHVEHITSGDEKTLTDDRVHNLVSAMAAFTPPPFGQTTLSASQQIALAPTISANWV